MSLRDQIRAAIAADPRSLSKVSRDADMPVQTVYALLKGANSTLATLEPLADTLGYELRLVRKEA